MAHEFIYTSYRLARHYPPDRTVLGEHIDLVLSGREDRRHRLERGGQVQPPADHGRAGTTVHQRGPPHAPGSRSATSAQEPLDPTKDVKGSVMDGIAEVQGLIDALQRR